MRDAVVAALDWTGPCYLVSAASRQGLDVLCGDLMSHLEERRISEQEDPELAEVERMAQEAMQAEAREQIEALRLRKREEARAARADADDWSDDDDEPDDDEAEWEYAP